MDATRVSKSDSARITLEAGRCLFELTHEFGAALLEAATREAEGNPILLRHVHAALDQAAEAIRSALPSADTAAHCDQKVA